jgi:hypothetical protein
MKSEAERPVNVCSDVLGPLIQSNVVKRSHDRNKHTTTRRRLAYPLRCRGYCIKYQ